MPKSQIGMTAISSCSELKSQSASEIAMEIASKSVDKRVETATESQCFEPPQLQIASGLDFKLLVIWPSKVMPLPDLPLLGV